VHYIVQGVAIVFNLIAFILAVISVKNHEVPSSSWPAGVWRVC
jgi:hypothetical protein